MLEEGDITYLAVAVPTRDEEVALFQTAYVPCRVVARHERLDAYTVRPLGGYGSDSALRLVKRDELA